mmetsp:Transcript_47677/g.119161  ORF Transcript_47677/g.119161 Transcript_47677/m.119161 type:complete len:243 (+) Transcript_47677:533-1261(+)
MKALPALTFLASALSSETSCVATCSVRSSLATAGTSSRRCWSICLRYRGTVSRPSMCPRSTLPRLSVSSDSHARRTHSSLKSLRRSPPALAASSGSRGRAPACLSAASDGEGPHLGNTPILSTSMCSCPLACPLRSTRRSLNSTLGPTTSGPTRACPGRICPCGPFWARRLGYCGTQASCPAGFLSCQASRRSARAPYTPTKGRTWPLPWMRLVPISGLTAAWLSPILSSYLYFPSYALYRW